MGSKFNSLNSSLTPLADSTSITIANSSITSAERKYIHKYGKVVVVDLVFTVGTTISDSNAILFTGLPKTDSYNYRFRLSNGSDASKPDLVLAVTTSGTIINQWTQGGIQPGQWQGQFMYITSE